MADDFPLHVAAREGLKGEAVDKLIKSIPSGELKTYLDQQDTDPPEQ